ncbi:hypothetical protein Tco_0858844 [Tanacetum coccineum]|uniref:Uncharacterized protein n=1 Tax=Tanacetum coccineum TaxID=301880 RepID=A0ABQ5BDN3_9ASTR
MKGFTTNDQADYYSGITSITVNGKNAYELKGKFLDDFHNNAFSGALWDYWKLGSDEVEPTNEKTLNLEETNQDDEQEIEWPTYSWREDGYCNGGNLPGAYIVGNTLRYQDLEWYGALKDSKLKEEALRNKAIMEGLINKDVESNDEDDERHELCGNETHELPVYNIRRFEMIKYSFGQDEEFVAVKENEYEDWTSTSEDACQAYQKIFRMMDEGWMVTRTE